LSWNLTTTLIAGLAGIGLVEAEDCAAQAVVAVGGEDAAGERQRHVVAHRPLLWTGGLRVADGKAGLLLGHAAIGLIGDGLLHVL